MREPRADEMGELASGPTDPEPLPYLTEDGTPDYGLIAEDLYQGFIKGKGDDLPDPESMTAQDDGVCYLHVSDHGNIEMYQYHAETQEWKSLWAFV